MIKIIKFRLRNLYNKHLKKAGGHIGRNVEEITMKIMCKDFQKVQKKCSYK